MKNAEPVVKKWYDGFEEGKFLGMRCKKCGHYECPPIPICGECGHYDMEWVELSGEGELVSCEVDNVPTYPFENRGPLMSGYVNLKEGPTFISWLIDVPAEERDSIPNRLPLQVEVVLDQRDGYKYPVFRLKK